MICKISQVGTSLLEVKLSSGNTVSLILPNLSILGFHYLFLFLRFPVACVGSWVHRSDSVVSVLECACSWKKRTWVPFFYFKAQNIFSLNIFTTLSKKNGSECLIDL